jgi:hypothetical protein
MFNLTNLPNQHPVAQVSQVPCPTLTTFRHRVGMRAAAGSSTTSRVVAATPEEAAFLLQARDRFRRESIEGVRSERVEMLDIRSREIEAERERTAASLRHMAKTSSLPRRKTAAPKPPRPSRVDSVIPAVPLPPVAAMPDQGGGDGALGSFSPWCAGDSTDVSL